ncbi:MAG: hypothetical protein IJZ79_03765 [Bacilli bacterium]|nr:hypothetical protein [Bacilli bacterium]MBQ8218847.1 hypothetical protein [Bacilli bacterium]
MNKTTANEILRTFCIYRTIRQQIDGPASNPNSYSREELRCHIEDKYKLFYNTQLNSENIINNEYDESYKKDLCVILTTYDENIDYYYSLYKTWLDYAYIDTTWYKENIRAIGCEDTKLSY